MKIKFFILLITLLFSQAIYGQTYAREILPFTGKKYSLTHFSFFGNETEDIFGIGFYFNSKGKKITGSSFLALLKLNSNKEYEIYWKFEFPNHLAGDFTDFVIYDIDGDREEEILVSAGFYSPPTNFSPLFVFEKQNGTLVEDLSYDKNSIADLNKITELIHFYDFEQGVNFLMLSEKEKTQVCKLTFDRQTIYCTPLWFQKNPENYFESKLVKLQKDQNYIELVRTNSDLLYLTKFNFDSKIIRETTIFEPNGNVWDLTNLATGDFNGDSNNEMIIGLMNGGINLVRNKPDTTIVAELFDSFVDYDKIFALSIDDAGTDIVLSSADGQILKSYSYDPDSENFWNSTILVNTEMNGIKFLTHRENKRTQQACFSYIYPDFSHHGMLRISLNSEQPARMPSVSDSRDNTIFRTKPVFHHLDSLLSKITNIRGTPAKLNIPQKKEPLETGQSQYTVRKTDYVIPPQTKFLQKVDLYSVSSKNLNYTINAPEGFRFNLFDRSFSWTPSFSQLGYHEITAHFYWDDVEINKAFTIYVNDEVEIINKLPLRNIIQAGEIFKYQLQVKDRNADKAIKYSLVQYPDGASINNNGLITWKPNPDQADWHDFEVIVSDGYSDDHLLFSIFVNHPVKILPMPGRHIAVGENLNYKLQISDKNKGFYLNQYNIPPRIENWRQSGIYETLILSARAKSDLSAITTNMQKENHKIKHADFQIEEVSFEQNKLIIFFTYSTPEKPEFSSVFPAFFKDIRYDIPNHSSFTSPRFYKFTMKSAPNGFYITKDGILRGRPDMSNLGSNPVAFTVSDGYYSDETVLEILVNDPPKIISRPPQFANINELYEYQIIAEDNNPNDTLRYHLLSAPEQSEILKSGRLQWTVQQDNSALNNPFHIGVSDGKDTTYQRFTIQLNQKPVVQSQSGVITKLNRLFEYHVNASDPEGGSLSYKALQIPESANFDSEKGILFWKPAANDLGEHKIVIEVTDAGGNTATDNFTITVIKNKINIKTISLLSGAAILALTILLTL